MRFVRGLSAAMTAATPLIAVARNANTAPTPACSTAPINNEENAALSSSYSVAPIYAIM
jgi:hypothetical protein